MHPGALAPGSTSSLQMWVSAPPPAIAMPTCLRGAVDQLVPGDQYDFLFPFRQLHLCTEAKRTLKKSDSCSDILTDSLRSAVGLCLVLRPA